MFLSSWHARYTVDGLLLLHAREREPMFLSSWHARYTVDGLLVLPTVGVSDTHDHDEESENVEDEVKPASKQLHGNPAVRTIVHSCVIVRAITAWRDVVNSHDQPHIASAVNLKHTAEASTDEVQQIDRVPDQQRREC